MIRLTHIYKATRVGVVAAAITWNQGAAAQGVDSAQHKEDKALVLEEMVVSARKIEERLQDAAISVTSINGSTLEVRGIRDLAETTKLSSSLKYDSDADVRVGVSIRGVGQSSDVGAAPGVGMFIDGVYQPSSAYYSVPFFDVERIEILKGPQGTLYGKNTMGGAISIISRKPDEDLGGSIKVEGASGSQLVANGVLNVPIVGDVFANRTAVFYRKSDGQFPNETTGEDANERDDESIRSTFFYDPDNGFTSSLAFFYADLRSAPFRYSETDKGLNDPIKNVTKDINGEVVSKYKSLNFTNVFEFESVTITSLTSYDTGDVDTFLDGDFTGSPLLRVSGASERDTFAQELRMASFNANDSNFQWLLGAYYSNDDFKSVSQTEFNIPVLGFLPVQSGTKHETGDTYAAFGQVTWNLEKFEFLAGLRYDQETRDNESTGLAGLPPPLSPVPPAATEFKAEVVSEEWQPKVSVSYRFTPDIMGYALWSRGFRAGGFNGITAPPEYASYQPEKTSNFEVGLKTELLNRRLRLNTAVFYTDYTDKLLTDSVRGSDGSVTIISRNGGEAESYGVELDAAFRVSESLTLSGGYTYLKIKNDEIPEGGVRRELTGFPENAFNVQADYFRPLCEGIQLGAHASAAYVGEVWMGREPEKRDAVTLVDASLGLTFQNVAFVDDLTITVFGKNVFDEKYYTSYLPAVDTIVQTSALGQLNQPSQFGVRIAASF